MGSFTVFVALTWMVCSQAAPVTEFFGAPQIIEDNISLDYPNPDQFNKVEEMERFHRAYKNGTVEFKMALSNGHVQYQRISSKIVDGDKVQVFEGYISEKYKDGRYGTRYYAADENGYRSSAVIIENDPPKLPSSGPYSSNLPRDIQNQLSPLNEDDTETKPKALIDNSVDLEEEQLPNLNQGSNVENENSVSTTESEKVKHLENEDILKSGEPSVVQNFNGVQTVLPLDLDLTSSTEFSSISGSENNSDKVSEELLPAFEADSHIDVASESSTDQTLNEETTEASLDLSTLEEEQSVKKDLSGSFYPLSSSEVLSEGVENVKVPYEESIAIVVNTEHPIDKVPEASTETLLKKEEVPLIETPAQSAQSQELNTEVPEINEVKIGGETSRNLKYPLEDSESETTTVLTDDIISTNSAEEEENKVLTGEPSLEIIEDKSIESIESKTETESNSDPLISIHASENENRSTEVNELPTENENSGESKSEIPAVAIEEIIPNLEISTEKSFNEVSEETTHGHLLNDEVTSTEQTSTFNNEAHEQSTEIPEINDVKIDGKTSRNLRYPLEDSESETTDKIISKNSDEEEELTKVLTEQPSLEVIEDKSTESNATSDNVSNIDLSTSSPVLENETQSIGINELPTEKSNSDGISTDLPLENSTNHDDEASEEVQNDQDISSSEKDARSLDVLKVLPLPETNLTSIAERSGSGTNEEETNISSTSINSENNEETTNKIEISTDKPELIEEVSISTIASDENNNSDATTEAEVVLTTQINGLEASSSEKSEGSITEINNQISTDEPLISKSSEENSNEENKEESKENSNEENKEESKENLNEENKEESKENLNKENKEKSTEDQESTELLVESGEEKHSRATNIDNSTEAEVLSTTDETESKANVVEIEFYPPVINF